MEAVAKVENLTVTFRRDGLAIRAIRGVSLEMRRGEILGLVAGACPRCPPGRTPSSPRAEGRIGC